MTVDIALVHREILALAKKMKELERKMDELLKEHKKVEKKLEKK